jgi:hypothetical protein
MTIASTPNLIMMCPRRGGFTIVSMVQGVCTEPYIPALREVGATCQYQPGLRMSGIPDIRAGARSLNCWKPEAKPGLRHASMT